MKGHNYNGICKKCGLNHIHPKGMENKKHSNETKNKMKQFSIYMHENMSLKDRLEREKKIGIKVSGKKNGMYGIHRFGKDSPAYGYKHSKLNKEKIRLSSMTMWKEFTKEEYKKICKKIGISHKNKIITEETKNKMSKSAYKRIERDGCYQSIGKNETHILETLEKCFGYKIIPQYKILKYFVDGYCPNLNLVIEVDEKYHFDINGKLSEYDIKRQEKIEEEINCKFLRIQNKGGLQCVL